MALEINASFVQHVAYEENIDKWNLIKAVLDGKEAIDNGKEIRGEIVTQPVSGTLFAYEDSSFTFAANDGSYFFEYQLYVDGVATGLPARVDLTIGGAVINATLAGSSTATYQAAVLSETAPKRKPGGSVWGMTRYEIFNSRWNVYAAQAFLVGMGR